MHKKLKPSDIKVGVIGYGGSYNMGKFHLDYIQKAGMSPAVVTDKDPARLEIARKDFPGIETYSSVEDMLSRSSADLVIIITPHNTHAQLAVQCLNAGKHVVVEKPMAITTAECDRMIAAAKRKKLILSTFHNRHWDGNIMNTVAVIKSGALGDIVRLEARMGNYGKPRDWWRASKSISGGILYDWGVHYMEYTLQVMRASMVEVTGFAKTGFWKGKTAWKDDVNEDEATIAVRYANGSWSSLTLSSIDARPRPFDMEITGTLGKLVWNGPGAQWEMVTFKDGNRVLSGGNHGPSQYEHYYQNIADHLSKEKPLFITAEWARRPIHVIDLAYQSAKLGRSVKVKYK